VWSTASHGLSFRRAIESLAPLFMEARVQAEEGKGIIVCAASEELSSDLFIPFDGDEVQFPPQRKTVVFALDLKEAASWMSTFREGMRLEVTFDEGKKLTLGFYTEGKEFQHHSVVSNLRLSKEHVMPITGVTKVAQVVDVSATALNAVVRNHVKCSSHFRLYADDAATTRLVVESTLWGIEDDKISVTKIAGARKLQDTCGAKWYGSEFLAEGSAADVMYSGELYSLSLFKKVLKACSLLDKKTGRVTLCLNPRGAMAAIFTTDSNVQLVFHLPFVCLEQEKEGTEGGVKKEEAEDDDMPNYSPTSPSYSENAPENKVIKRKQKDRGPKTKKKQKLELVSVPAEGEPQVGEKPV